MDFYPDYDDFAIAAQESVRLTGLGEMDSFWDGDASDIKVRCIEP